jgi:hypothetical protein
MSDGTIRLAPDQLAQLADLIAARVSPCARSGCLCVDNSPSPAAGRDADRARLLDAAELAGEFGVARSWVYAHAAELGAIRLGGERGRLRFDLATARAAFTTAATTATTKPAAQPTTATRRRTSTAGSVLNARPRGRRKSNRSASAGHEERGSYVK